MQTNKTYISDVVGKDYQYWKKGDVIAFDAATGTGKTRFITEILTQYARFCRMKILFLSSRNELKDKIIDRIEALDKESPNSFLPKFSETLTVESYQKIQQSNYYRSQMSNYDYIIADECHYFLSDASFNDKTDVAFNAVINQPKSVVILMSATANGFFEWLKGNDILEEKNIYRIPADYSYISHLYFYKRGIIKELIDQVLKEEPDSKIVVFTNYDGLEALYKTYGENANYYCSEFANNNLVKKIRDSNCIRPRDDGTITFDKRILVTTTALDVGIDLIDKRIKHIYCEVLDTDTLLQCIGRKRIIDDSDTVDIHVRIIQSNWIKGALSRIENKLRDVELFMRDREGFVLRKLDNRDLIRKNEMFYIAGNAEGTNGELAVNEMIYRKNLIDCEILRKMLQSDSKQVIIELFGNSIEGKVEIESAITREVKEEVLTYIQSLEGEKVFDKKELYAQLGKLYVLIEGKDSRIGTVNGLLDDVFPDYNYRFTDCDEHGKKLRLSHRALDADGKTIKKRNSSLYYWYLKPTS